MKLNEIVPILGNGATWIMSALQSNETLQIIEFCLSALTSLIIIFFKVWRWWKESSADGKITKDEIDKLADDLDEDIDKLKDKK